MKQYIHLLRQATLLNSISDEDILTYLKNGSFKIASYSNNSVIHFDGEVCNKMEIILTGKVVVDSIDEAGHLLTISDFYAGDILGGHLLFSKNPYYPMTISTQSPTQILEIEKETMFNLLSMNPGMLQAYLESVSDNAFILGDKIKNYVNKTIRESIMNYLNYESKKQNSNHIKIGITKKALAEKIGVQRTSLSRELAKMRDDGLIEFDRDTITIL